MKNLKKYEDLSKSDSKIFEGVDQANVESCIDLLSEAKEKMEEALYNLKTAYRNLERTELSTTAQRLRSYIIGNLEPMITSDHEWMTRAISIEDIIKELEESGFEEQESEEE
jgi:hypothetical protein